MELKYKADNCELIENAHVKPDQFLKFIELILERIPVDEQVFSGLADASVMMGKGLDNLCVIINFLFRETSKDAFDERVLDVFRNRVENQGHFQIGR